MVARGPELEIRYPEFSWEFRKIGDPNVVPKIVGSLLYGPQNKVALISRYRPWENFSTFWKYMSGLPFEG